MSGDRHPSCETDAPRLPPRSSDTELGGLEWWALGWSLVGFFLGNAVKVGRAVTQLREPQPPPTLQPLFIYFLNNRNQGQ